MMGFILLILNNFLLLNIFFKKNSEEIYFLLDYKKRFTKILRNCK